MNKNDRLEALYALKLGWTIKAMQIEQNILDNPDNPKRFAWLEELVEVNYQIFKAYDSIRAIYSEPAPKRTIIQKFLRKN